MRNTAGSETEWRSKKGSLFLMAVFSFRFTIRTHRIVHVFLMLSLDILDFDDNFSLRCNEMFFHYRLSYCSITGYKNTGVFLVKHYMLHDPN